MIIKHKIGNLVLDVLNKEVDGAAHQANCFHVMGSGIAREFRERIPVVYEVDKATIRGKFEKLGHISHCSLQNGADVFNVYGQFHFDRTNQDYGTRYAALFSGLRKVKSFIKNRRDIKNYTLGLPKIGCGLAGGNWEYVKNIIINDIFVDTDITIVFYEKG